MMVARLIFPVLCVFVLSGCRSKTDWAVTTTRPVLGPEAVRVVLMSATLSAEIPAKKIPFVPVLVSGYYSGKSQATIVHWQRDHKRRKWIQIGWTNTPMPTVPSYTTAVHCVLGESMWILREDGPPKPENGAQVER